MRRTAVFLKRFLIVGLLIAAAIGAQAQTAAPAPVPFTLNDEQPLYAEGVPFMIRGTAAPGTAVTVKVGDAVGGATADIEGRWQVLWTAPLSTGTYDVVVTAGDQSTTQVLRVQERGALARQPGFDTPPRYADPVFPNPDAVKEMTDRWRIVPPPYELDEKPRARKIGDRGATLDPYNQNLLKGDLPIYRDDTFFVLTAISDTLAESRSVPVPSGVSSAEPSSFPFFGDGDQNVFLQTFIVSGDLFQGDTTFQPVRQRLKATLIGNLNVVQVEETGILKPDVRRGTQREDGHGALQEFFYERLLKVLSPNYDFLSLRIGSQPFLSDFRGFIFSDTNLGVRLSGNYAQNRFQYNLAYFDRLEKDTNSGLNTLNEFRDQKVAIANFYWQDFFFRGYTQQFSIHAMKDDASLKFDRNGILVRPAPVGDFTPHEIDAYYIGTTSQGHIERINIDSAIYYVFGTDSLNPIAGPDPQLRDDDEVKIGAGMVAVELSYDKDWLRPRIGFFWASGDKNPRDRDAHGFDSIFDNTNFAGGGFSFFNRLGIRLAGTGVALVERGSLYTSLRSSKDEGQPNYVNPGLQLGTIGLDVEVTPRLKAIFTGNYIRLDAVEPIEEVLFQDGIRKELGTDLSVGLRYRPFLNNNMVIVGGAAAFIPGQGFKDIYESGDTLYHVFTNLILQF